MWRICNDCHHWFGAWQVESLWQGRGPEQHYSWDVLGHVSLAVRPEGVQSNMSLPVCGKVRIIHSTFCVSIIAFGSRPWGSQAMRTVERETSWGKQGIRRRIKRGSDRGHTTTIYIGGVGAKSDAQTCDYPQG